MSARKLRLLLSLIAFCPGTILRNSCRRSFEMKRSGQAARVVNNFYEVYPYSLDTGHKDTKILIRGRREGLCTSVL